MADDLKTMPEDYWKQKLTPEQYRVLRESGTEPPFVGEHVDTEAPGMYKCGACGLELFRSDTKYHSGSGWPSFWDVTDRERVELIDDDSHGMHRVEVRCARCGSHLGHLFPDGPAEHGGQRYCINSLSLDFEPEKGQ